MHSQAIRGNARILRITCRNRCSLTVLSLSTGLSLHNLYSTRLALPHGDKHPLKMHRRLALVFDGCRESDPSFALLMKSSLKLLQHIRTGTNADSTNLAPHRTLIGDSALANDDVAFSIFQL